MRALLILLFLLQPTPPPFSAFWDGPGAATVTWTQTARGCLYRQPSEGAGVFVGCYERAGTYRVTFGHVGAMDAAYRPRAGDVYKLVTGGQTYSAPLRARPLFFPVFRG